MVALAEGGSMVRAFVLALMLGFFAAPAAAGGSSWSIGWSDYGRHGGYSVSFGRHHGASYRAYSWHAPVWYAGGYGYDRYGYDRWNDPWFVASYSPRRSYGWHDDCYYDCGRSYGYRYAPRSYSRHYAPPRTYYRYEYRDRDWRHDRHYRYDRHDRGHRSRGYSYDRHDRGYSSYKRHERDGRHRETAYQRVRDHGYNAHDDAWRGQRQRREW
jgi:hypothetical protein